LEKSFEDILVSFFPNCFFWTVAFVSLLSLSFGDFFCLFLLSS
jgi:hypothetical protein